MPEKISACITAGNEEKNIRRCLESVRWADEIVVVDSFSTDRTVEICREYTPLVYQHKWLGYIGQKNLIKDMAAGPWILFIDADEEISPSLRDEILAEFRTDASRGVDGYEFPRLVRYLGTTTPTTGSRTSSPRSTASRPSAPRASMKTAGPFGYGTSCSGRRPGSCGDTCCGAASWTESRG